MSIKSLVRAVVPQRMQPYPHLASLVKKHGNTSVMKGPFKGMKYGDNTFGSAYLPKLLGIYEYEIADVIEQAIALGFDQVIDIGAAEGYYAVGFSLRCPSARVIAYEISPTASEMLRRMASLNGVADKIVFRGACTRPQLQDDLQSSSRNLVICDCEGYELILLDPLRVPSLRHAHILVEAHDGIVGGIVAELSERFAATHAVTSIEPKPRVPGDFPFRDAYSRLFPGRFFYNAVREFRNGPTPWLWMQPKPAA